MVFILYGYRVSISAVSLTNPTEYPHSYPLWTSYARLPFPTRLSLASLAAVLSRSASRLFMLPFAFTA